MDDNDNMNNGRIVDRIENLSSSTIKVDQLVNYKLTYQEELLSVSGETRGHVICYVNDHVISLKMCINNFSQRPNNDLKKKTVLCKKQI